MSKNTLVSGFLILLGLITTGCATTGSNRMNWDITSQMLQGAGQAMSQPSERRTTYCTSQINGSEINSICH